MSSRTLFSGVVVVTAVIFVSFNEAQGSYYSDYSDDYSDEDWDLMPGGRASGRNIVAKVLHAEYTNWGKWGDWEYCEPGYYALTARINVEDYLYQRDDSSVNGIELHCVKWGSGHVEHPITSWVGKHGDYWTDTRGCIRQTRMIGFSLKVEKHQGHCGVEHCDDTATTGLRVHCGYWRNGDLRNGASHELYGNKWGEWQEAKLCPTGSYVCGIRTQIDNHGNDHDASHGNKDITGLNSVEMACCTK